MKENDEKYRIWEIDKSYGEVFYDRATGKRDEMESSKALCQIISPFYKKRMKLLDVGCGTGHYLRSLRRRLDENIDYTGTDITEYYINRAREAFKDVPFYVADIHDIPFEDNSFDIVTCNNVILHLPPPPRKAISELLRVSSKYIVIRIPFGMRNYIIKEIRSHEDKLDEEDLKIPGKEGDLIDETGEPIAWNYLNIYTMQYIRDVIKDIDENAAIKIIDDTFWDDLRDRVDSPTATKTIDGKQVSGNIILDWKFLVIEKR